MLNSSVYVKLFFFTFCNKTQIKLYYNITECYSTEFRKTSSRFNAVVFSKTSALCLASPIRSLDQGLQK